MYQNSTCVDRLIPGHMSSFWHMTLAVSKDHAKIQRRADRMAESVNYPNIIKK